MGRRDYDRLDIETFGRQLIKSGDLDPVYVALHGAGFSPDLLARWLIAYWCLYHCGAASYIAEHEGREFWKPLMDAASNEAPAPTGGRWPRGHERRHFRGQQGIRAVSELQGRYLSSPEQMVQRITRGGLHRPLTFEEVATAVREHRGFGPWIAFKVADMVDRVLGMEVDFTEAAVSMFKDPVKAALMLWRQKTGAPEIARPKDQASTIHEVVNYLTVTFGDLKAPPLRDRPVGLQEVETVLCKWKSHMNGHYPLWNDIDEINRGLAEWAPHSRVAQQFASAMPRRP